jgi:hypothetical protein
MQPCSIGRLCFCPMGGSPQNSMNAFLSNLRLCFLSGHEESGAPMRMLDGFNEGWIEFERGLAGSQKGIEVLKTALRTLIDRQKNQRDSAWFRRIEDPGSGPRPTPPHPRKLHVPVQRNDGLRRSWANSIQHFSRRCRPKPACSSRRDPRSANPAACQKGHSISKNALSLLVLVSIR